MVCEADPSKYKTVKIHTAKCSVCDKRNQQELLRCPECSYQICTPCVKEKNGAPLLHGSMSTKKMPAPPPRRPAFGAAIGYSQSADSSNATKEASKDDKEKSAVTDNCGGADDVVMIESTEETTPTPRMEVKKPPRALTALEKATRAPAGGVGKAPHRIVEAAPRPIPDPDGRANPTKSNPDIVPTLGRAQPFNPRGINNMTDVQLQHLFQYGLGYSQGGSPLVRQMPQYGPLPPTMVPERIARQAPRSTPEQVTANIQRQLYRHMEGQRQQQAQQQQMQQQVQQPYQAVGQQIPPQNDPRLTGSRPGSRPGSRAPTPGVDDSPFFTIRMYVEEYMQDLRNSVDFPLNIDQVSNLLSQMSEIARKFMLNVEVDSSPVLRHLFSGGLDGEYNYLSSSQKKELEALTAKVGWRLLNEYEEEVREKAAAEHGPAVGLFHASPSKRRGVEAFKGVRMPRRAQGGDGLQPGRENAQHLSPYSPVPAAQGTQGSRRSLPTAGPAAQGHTVPAQDAAAHGTKANPQDIDMS